MDQMKYRVEHDFLGEKQISKDCLWGINTARALDNFSIAGYPVHKELIRAYGTVKLACVLTNKELGVWDNENIPAAIAQACREMLEGNLSDHIVVDALQGGAGTSTNMNVNEVIANHALQIMGQPAGTYALVSPIDDVNLHQSTNDTFPTALRCNGTGCFTGITSAQRKRICACCKGRSHRIARRCPDDAWPRSFCLGGSGKSGQMADI
jgi:aspartate ammonia-lyase